MNKDLKGVGPFGLMDGLAMTCGLFGLGCAIVFSAFSGLFPVLHEFGVDCWFALWLSYMAAMLFQVAAVCKKPSRENRFALTLYAFLLAVVNEFSGILRF